MTTLLLLTVLSAPGLPTVAKAEPAPELDAKFRRTDGWVGGDGAFSVPVSDQRTLWLFSDTWIGTIRDGKRQAVAMVNNTVGVQEGHGADAKITYAIAKGQDGKPGTLFVPPEGTGWFWLFSGFHVDGTLHVFLPRLEKTDAGGAFGFRSTELWLATVSNPLDEPTKWKITYAKVPFAEFGPKLQRSFGTATLRTGEHVYIFGYDERPAKPFPARKLLVARAPANQLADFDSWRFLGANGTWSARATDAVLLADQIGTEMSVSYLPGLKRYVLVYTELGLSDRIVGRFADAPEGPWSEPMLLYRCPEMKQDKKVFSYAAKAHPHLATNGSELVISYVVNAFELAPVINNPDLYWPRFVRVTLK